jgi:Subtilase family
MAVTATDERDRGQPTSWSAAIDALAVGRVFDPATQGLVYLDEAQEGARRLFILSAGNVAPNNFQNDHLGRSDLEAVHDPAHAWNALTVGACTEKSTIGDPTWKGWSPLAPPGDLSPWSTTSVTFQDRWPIKPDIVCEGGNVATDGGIFDNAVPDLCLLSTHFRPAERTLVLSWATSAATAQISRMAAIIRAEYPEYWPETVRALIVHSAQWTRAMQSHLRGAGGKRARAKLVRRYGFGVPELGRALRSANDSLTLVAQATIHPFAEGKMREMHLHELPWPKAILEELGQTPVRLRVTLSYFVEPNPGRRGWKKRHRYASHGLRFDLKTPTETADEFRKRLNQLALQDDEGKPDPGSGASEWFLGEKARNKGSIHSDMWVGTAADLAERGVVGIYPVSGWWKDQPKRDRSNFGARYALVLSIETDAQDVDIWTPVAQQIGVPLEETTIGI